MISCNNICKKKYIYLNEKFVMMHFNRNF